MTGLMVWRDLASAWTRPVSPRGGVGHDAPALALLSLR